VEYNTGTGEDRRKAIDAISDYNKLLISLATGTIVLSATFLEKFYRGTSLHLLILAWAALGLSVVFGLFSYGEYINQLAESNIKPRHGRLEILSLFQWGELFAGVVLFGFFVVNNVTKKPEHKTPMVIYVCCAPHHCRRHCPLRGHRRRCEHRQGWRFRSHDGPHSRS
jgi:hypothetical protein